MERNKRKYNDQIQEDDFNKKSKYYEGLKEDERRYNNVLFDRKEINNYKNKDDYNKNYNYSKNRNGGYKNRRNEPQYIYGNYPNYYDKTFRGLENDKRIDVLNNISNIISNKKNLLDIGCNIALFTNEIAKRCSRECKVTGVDIGLIFY